MNSTVEVYFSPSPPQKETSSSKSLEWWLSIAPLCNPAPAVESNSVYMDVKRPLRRQSSLSTTISSQPSDEELAMTSFAGVGSFTATTANSSSPKPAARSRKIMACDIHETIQGLAGSANQWNPNHHKVERMFADGHHYDRMHLVLRKHDRAKLAMKLIPTDGAEESWYSIGVLKTLSKMKYQYAMEILDIMYDVYDTKILMPLANGGDLFSFCAQAAKPGVALESRIAPLALQICSAVRSLHDLGIAHRNLSLEGILLTHTDAMEVRVKLIDFGKSVSSRICKGNFPAHEVFKAPEIASDQRYDAFLADDFSVGVIMFALAAQDFPWKYTQDAACKLFKYYSEVGFEKFIARRKLRGDSSTTLSEVFSPELSQLLKGLLELNVQKRLCLGEACYLKDSVWDMDWMSSSVQGGAIVHL